MLRIKQYAYWQIVTAFLAGILAVFVLQYLYKDSYTVEQAVLNAGFLLAYLIILVLQKKDLPDKEGRKTQAKQVSRILIFVFLMILCVAETAINANETGYSTTDRVAYTEDNADIEELLDSVEDGSFFRVEKAKRRTKNDGAWSDYRSASVCKLSNGRWINVYTNTFNS